MSIRHIVLWRLAADDADTRAIHARELAERLTALKDAIDEVDDIEVGPNVAFPGTNWDVALVADFADTAALERYLEHPEHRKVGAFVREVTSDRAAIDLPR